MVGGCKLYTLCVLNYVAHDHNNWISSPFVKSFLAAALSVGVHCYPQVFSKKQFVVVFLMLVTWFSIIRAPYVYGYIGFAVVVVSFVVVIYHCVFFNSVWFNGVLVFISTLLPGGTPYFISPLVCLSELSSMALRPVVLALRPVGNMSIGVVASDLVAGVCVEIFVFLFVYAFLSIYELAVLVIHSFIVWFLVEVTCNW